MIIAFVCSDVYCLQNLPFFIYKKRQAVLLIVKLLALLVQKNKIKAKPFLKPVKIMTRGWSFFK